MAPEFIMMAVVLRNGSLSLYKTHELLHALYYSEKFYKEVLKDTATGSKWSAVRRGAEAEKFRSQILNELLRREQDASEIDRSGGGVGSEAEDSQ